LGTAGSVLTSGTTTSLSADNYTFQNIAVPLNVAGISALTSDPASLYFELRFTDTGSAYYFGQKFSVLVDKAIATAGTIATPTTDRALTVSEAQLGYVRYDSGAGRGIRIPSADGTKAT